MVGTGLFLAVVLGLGLGTVVVLLRTPILLLCGATETVLPYAQPYLGITAYGLPFLLFTTAGSMLIRADGSPVLLHVLHGQRRCRKCGAGLDVHVRVPLGHPGCGGSYCGRPSALLPALPAVFHPVPGFPHPPEHAPGPTRAMWGA